MFARTERLTLRPAWPEDAGTLAAAIGQDAVARMLSRVPHPYGESDAATWIAQPRGAEEPRFVILAHHGSEPELVGAIAIAHEADGPNLGYWLTPDAWGRGYATEAGRAVVAMARHALPLRRLNAWHFADNPASGKVLRKLGFRPTGDTMPRRSAARAASAPAVGYALDLADDDRTPLPIAA